MRFAGVIFLLKSGGVQACWVDGNLVTLRYPPYLLQHLQYLTQAILFATLAVVSTTHVTLDATTSQCNSKT